jgi:xanthine dehydrogenase accessory factor
MYVFGAVDHAEAVSTVGSFLGYRVTVCDARARFATRERFPDVDELVVEWPDEFLRRAPVDARTAIVVLTHDAKFDVPLLVAALHTAAAYVGAMGSRTTTEERAERLRGAGVTEEQLARLHAPIGLSIGARSPEEVAVSIAAELIEVTRRRVAAGSAPVAPGIRA